MTKRLLATATLLLALLATGCTAAHSARAIPRLTIYPPAPEAPVCPGPTMPGQAVVCQEQGQQAR